MLLCPENCMKLKQIGPKDVPSAPLDPPINIWWLGLNWINPWKVFWLRFTSSHGEYIYDQKLYVVDTTDVCCPTQTTHSVSDFDC